MLYFPFKLQLQSGTRETELFFSFVFKRTVIPTKLSQTPLSCLCIQCSFFYWHLLGYGRSWWVLVLPSLLVTPMPVLLEGQEVGISSRESLLRTASLLCIEDNTQGYPAHNFFSPVIICVLLILRFYCGVPQAIDTWGGWVNEDACAANSEFKQHLFCCFSTCPKLSH